MPSPPPPEPAAPTDPGTATFLAGIWFPGGPRATWAFVRVHVQRGHLEVGSSRLPSRLRRCLSRQDVGSLRPVSSWRGSCLGVERPGGHLRFVIVTRRQAELATALAAAGSPVDGDAPATGST